jgi:hypothetical protein
MQGHKAQPNAGGGETRNAAEGVALLRERLQQKPRRSRYVATSGRVLVHNASEELTRKARPLRSLGHALCIFYVNQW